MTKRRVYDKAYRRQSNLEIAEAARHLIDLVREQIDTRGRVSSDLICDIKRQPIRGRELHRLSR
jgi:hypothetical protein